MRMRHPLNDVISAACLSVAMSDPQLLAAQPASDGYARAVTLYRAGATQEAILAFSNSIVAPHKWRPALWSSNGATPDAPPCWPRPCCTSMPPWVHGQGRAPPTSTRRSTWRDS